MAKVTQAAKIGCRRRHGGGGYLVYRTISKTTGSGSGYVVHAYVTDATGVAKHSRVTIAGIPVGSIEDIGLENGKARIDVKVNREVKLHATARLASRAPRSSARTSSS